MELSRRQFMKGTLSIGTCASLGIPTYSLASPSNDFRALVCVYLDGGNDAYNTILPLSDFHYNQYANVRGSLSVAKETILPTGLKVSDSAGNMVPLGLHPKLAALESIFALRDANIAINSGILDQPVTKQAITSGRIPLPDQLFSHNSQTDSWLRGGMDASRNLGWAGRMLDVLTSSSQITPLYSLHGESLWLRAMEHRQTLLKKDRAVELSALNTALYRDIYDQVLAHTTENPFSDHFNLMVNDSMTISSILSNQLGRIEDNPLFTSSTLGKQMQTVFKLIASQSELGQQRQVFYVKHSGYDLHDSQLVRHPKLLEDLAANLFAMYQATKTLGVGNNVTTFTMSDFGRRIPNNGNGTDHGWGGHQLLLGGAVNADQPIGIWPSLVLDGEEDYSKGRIIPTTAADQVGATLAQWMGVSDNTALEYVFPNIRNFPVSNLGFMT